MLRRLFPGANPDLEVADALARLGSDRVAAPFGWIETQIGGEPVLLGVLSEFLAHASDGWKLATQTLGRLYARQGAYGQEYLTAPVPADGAADWTGAGLPFAAEARQLGTATAQMHVDMATAFGSRAMAPERTGGAGGHADRQAGPARRRSCPNSPRTPAGSGPPTTRSRASASRS